MFSLRLDRLAATVLAGGVALVVSTAAPEAVHAQMTTEIRGGSSIPAGDIDDLTDGGAFLGVGLGWRTGGRFTLRADGDFEMLNEDHAGRTTLPRTYLWHLQGGAELDVTNPETSEWLLRLRGGAGATVYDTKRLTVNGDDFMHTYFSAGGGLSLGRRVTSGLEAGVFGRMNVVFTDKDEIRELTNLAPTQLDAFSKGSTFPLGVYVRWSGLAPSM
jgi:hypothetical protein